MADAQASAGVVESAKRLGATFIDIAQTRLTLLGTDVEEAAQRFVGLIVWCSLALFFFVLGVVLAALLLVAIFWDTHRLLALGVASTVFLFSSAVAIAAMFYQARTRPRLFSATIAELGKDRQQLGAGS
jgi:uncharacterized membrane protein YqjE